MFGRERNSRKVKRAKRIRGDVTNRARESHRIRTKSQLKEINIYRGVEEARRRMERKSETTSERLWFWFPRVASAQEKEKTLNESGLLMRRMPVNPQAYASVRWPDLYGLVS